MSITRKTFLRQAGALGLLTCCGGILLTAEGCKTTAVNLHPEFQDGEIRIPLAQFQTASLGILRDDRLQAPVCISKQSETAYEAVVMICTHKGCELDLAGKILVCPCHGSEFSAEGTVLRSPAEEDLVKIPVKVQAPYLILQIPS